MNISIASIREEYTLAELSETDVLNNPILQFEKWFKEAIHASIDDVNAMTLATVDHTNKPHARIVLLKGIENNQFSFFTNYKSHKGQQLDSNPHASLVFYWKELQRQIRIEGIITKMSSEDSTTYFHSRPIESQIGAWASHQSETLGSRQELEERMAQLSELYKDKMIPKPPHWGGYLVNPTSIEFWQGRANRLHDRLQFTKGIENKWQMLRLNP